MAQTVLITGCSSGIGKATALQFYEAGWNVAATMRQPDAHTELQPSSRLKLYTMDITKPETIHAAVDACLADFGGIDVVVNNAGFALLGAFECTSPEQVHRQFDTNVFGTMHVIRAVLPHFRAQQSGLIINVTSIGAQVAMPLYSLYHGTKWAMEGFSESLQYELRPFHIRVKVVLPGAVQTEFWDRQALLKSDEAADYDSYAQAVYDNYAAFAKRGAASPPAVIAKRIFEAATDGSTRFRYTAGRGAGLTLFLKRWLPTNLYFSMVRRTTEPSTRSFQR